MSTRREEHKPGVLTDTRSPCAASARMMRHGYDVMISSRDTAMPNHESRSMPMARAMHKANGRMRQYDVSNVPSYSYRIIYGYWLRITVFKGRKN